MQRKIFVTGATGFLGGWLVSDLVEAGFDVIVCRNTLKSERKDKNSLYELKNLAEKVTEIQLNLFDFDAVSSCIASTKPDVIIHMAAIGDVNTGLEKPHLTFQTSVTSTLNLLESVRLHRPETLFIAHTTDKVYSGNPVPFTEDMPLMPNHIYEVGKVSKEHLTRVYASTYGLSAVTIRCGNYFGGYDFNFDRIVPYVIRQNIHQDTIELRSNGKFTRDFLYIKDAVGVNRLLIDKHMDGNFEHYGEAFNFSLEMQLNVLDVTQLICNMMDRSHQTIVINDQTKFEIPDMVLSCKKAQQLLGWTPRYSLEAGLTETIDAYKEYFSSLDSSQAPASKNASG